MKKMAQMAQKTTKKESVNVRQKAFLKHLLADEVKFSITEAANLTKVGRRTVYNWLQTDEKFKAVFEDVQESRFDKIEATMHSKAVDEKDTTALIFLCKTLLKGRGYVEAGRVAMIDTGPILAKVIDDLMEGTTTIERAALELTKAGIPLPESIKIMLSRAEFPEPGSNCDSPSPEEFDKRYKEAIEASEQQRVTFVPMRQAEVAALKEAMKNDSWKNTNTTKEKPHD